MPTLSDLYDDLAGEILSRVPLTVTSLIAVRTTCKYWNALSKNQVFGKRAASSKQFIGFVLMGSRVYSMKFELQGIHNDVNIVDRSIKQVSILGQVKISKVFHCHGLLLLCVTEDGNQKLLMWNPYMGQTRSIQPLNPFSKYDMYAFGYDNKNGDHKILRFYGTKEGFLWLEVYDFNSNSWRVLDVTPGWDRMMSYYRSLSLKGNTYFLARKKVTNIEKIDELSLLSFDFTAERFGPLLPLPFQSYSYGSDPAALSCVRDEHLALLFLRKDDEVMEIWITTKIDTYSVSWSMFLKVETRPLPLFPAGDFFIDEAKKKVVVVSRFEESITAYIIGEDGYFKSADMGETQIRDEETWILYKIGYYYAFVFSSYVPSLVQLKETD